MLTGIQLSTIWPSAKFDGDHNLWIKNQAQLLRQMVQIGRQGDPVVTVLPIDCIKIAETLEILAVMQQKAVEDCLVELLTARYQTLFGVRIDQGLRRQLEELCETVWIAFENSPSLQAEITSRWYEIAKRARWRLAEQIGVPIDMQPDMEPPALLELLKPGSLGRSHAAAAV